MTKSHAQFTDEHLDRLAKIALEDQEGLFERERHLAVYRRRLLLIALCQGAALHYVQCKKGLQHTKGVKDLDVYSFYAEHPRVPWPYRRYGKADFGESEFGCHPDDLPYKGKPFIGRHVDLTGRALPVRPEGNPIEAVRIWLTTSKNPTPRHLREQAVVGLYPTRYQGTIMWDVSVDL
ncbi:hypothetical protein H7K24_14130 [Mycobacterium fragae]|uniref:Uncharacterized protein n=1 Tax=Mycobacterium fragae TaxID=1260918 RepID=A0A1X1UIW7_9MYCO|nr:hypothetical protein [Mycobacterium fragae]MCV7401292.1 hypothetical protein [Mycobacterium fragae]ORV56785.1 hypothetical protein AWC06_00800 [Mycobacterium fragae]